MYKAELDKILPCVQKPARYIGGEINSVCKDNNSVDLRFAFCFPDIYDIGMSHLGMKILYSLINSRDNYLCERVFQPWPDMETKMRENGILLYGLESLEPVKDFDIIGFTMQYELSYTAVLNMLDLAGLSVFAKDREGLLPIIVAGGPCVCNPEPIADFIDIFSIGEGEESTLELCDLLAQAKSEKWTKREFLEKAASIEGMYVPSLYEVSYNANGMVDSITPLKNAPRKIKKRLIKDFDSVFTPDSFVVPFSEIVHDRAVVEVLRGCIRGCRFCQAGFIYRPYREKSIGNVVKETRTLCESTGYEEVSLCSLSTGDFEEIESLLSELVDYTNGQRVNLSLPSLRIDRFSKDVLRKISSIRKSGLTFAPEAGTQRLRDAINKNVTDKNIEDTCRIAFEGGYTQVKLYFMLGLPTETMEDIEGIAKTAESIINLFYATPNRKKGKPAISISCSTFVPKPFTPFEFEPQNTESEISEKQQYLLKCIGNRKINVSWSDINTSRLEAALARGDRRLSGVIYRAWKSGCNLDSWGEFFNFNNWLDAFNSEGLDIDFYSNRRIGYDDIVPWSHIDMLINRRFLIRENKRAHENIATPNCRDKCSGCGLAADGYGCGYAVAEGGQDID